jgi:Domain of unknown function (DUF4124)
MMATYLRPAALAFLLGMAFGSPLAHADVYTWVDASGATNVSNLSPPEGVRVTRVIHENPQTTARPAAARDAMHDAEIQALSERVQQLQHEVEVARTYAPPPLPQPMAYPAIPPAPSPAYVPDVTPAPTSSCDPSFGDCGYWWGQAGYPANVVVVRAPSFRRAYPFRGVHHFVTQRPAQRPMRPAGGMRPR